MGTKIRRQVTKLTGMLLLGTLAAMGTPVHADEPTAGATALEFHPTDYPQCQLNGSARTIRSMVNKIVANSPKPFDDDGDPTDEDAPLYRQPPADERTDFRSGLRALIQDDPATAAARLADAGYAACGGEIDGTSSRHTVLVYHPAGLSATDTEGAPMLLLSPGMADTATVLSGPHLRSELRIKDQILAAVARAGLGYVRGAVLSGTHRCNRLAEAPPEYQGRTGMCGGRYRVSDMAHNVDTIFQDMHDVLREEYPLTFNVQLHGMSAAGISVSRGDDPDDGGASHPHDAVTRAHSYAEVYLKPRLDAAGFTADRDNLTSCTPFTHSGSGLPAPVRDLHCGTRNAQLDREHDLGGADRFIHIEQSLNVRNHYPEHIVRVMYGLFAY